MTNNRFSLMPVLPRAMAQTTARLRARRGRAVVVPVIDEARNVACGNRPADEEALAAVAAHDREEVERCAILDSFGADSEPQVVAELD